MNTRSSFNAAVFSVATLFSAVAAVNATPVPMNITVDSAGNLLFGVGLSIKDNNYLANNNNPESNFAFLQQEVGFYNATHNPDLTTPVGPVAADFGSLGGPSSYVALAGYEYVVLHFGAGDASYESVIPAHWEPGKGKNKTPVWVLETVTYDKPAGGWWSAWYLGGQSVQFDLPYLNGNVGGFSSARYFNKIEIPPVDTGGGDPTPMVPEGGSTMLLLGSAFVALVLGFRKSRKV